MTPEQYRAKWSLPSDYPMVAPNYAAQRSALAKSIGLWQLRQRPVAAAPSASSGEIEAAAVPPASADAIDAAAHEAAAVAASRAKTKTKTKGKSESKVAVPPEATAKRKSGRARKATPWATGRWTKAAPSPARSIGRPDISRLVSAPRNSGMSKASST